MISPPHQRLVDNSCFSHDTTAWTYQFSTQVGTVSISILICTVSNSARTLSSDRAFFPLPAYNDLDGEAHLVKLDW